MLPGSSVLKEEKKQESKEDIRKEKQMDGWMSCVAIKLGDKPAAGLFNSLILKTRKATICFYPPATPEVLSLYFFSFSLLSSQNLFFIHPSLPLHSISL